eukprot:TRINITY_DN5272_c0_g1_i2.p1 TRINITY_DN5272_c0_g1~~TRINITY_DN5272_c0_g1_i2.p1  ORF type:complete len:380 (-),score=130.32 TRINITY_DN5272_c0_g1_i2:356-1495(-)
MCIRDRWYQRRVHGNTNKEEIPQETSPLQNNKETLDLENKEDSIIIAKKESEDDLIEAALIMGIEDEPEGNKNQQEEEEKELNVNENVLNPSTEENNLKEEKVISYEEKKETQIISDKIINKFSVERNEDIPDNKDEIDIKQSEEEPPKESEKYLESKSDESEKMLLNNIEKSEEEMRQEHGISTNNKDDQIFTKEEEVEGEGQHKIEEEKLPNDLEEQVSNAPPNDLKGQVSDTPPNELDRQVSDTPPNELDRQVSDTPPNELKEQVSDTHFEESKNEEKHSDKIITEEDQKTNNESTPSKLIQDNNVLIQTEKDRHLSENNKNVPLIKEENGEEEKSQSEEEKNDTERNNIPSDSPNISLRYTSKKIRGTNFRYTSK